MGDFGGLVVVGWSKHVDEGAAFGAFGAELVHDLALLVDIAAGTDVDKGRDDNAKPIGGYVSFAIYSVDGKEEASVPDGRIKCGNTVDLPLLAQPAPKDRVAVRSLAVLPDKNEGESGDERNAVAKEEIRDLHLPQSSSIELVVEGEIHVDGHC